MSLLGIAIGVNLALAGLNVGLFFITGSMASLLIACLNVIVAGYCEWVRQEIG